MLQFTRIDGSQEMGGQALGIIPDWQFENIPEDKMPVVGPFAPPQAVLMGPQLPTLMGPPLPTLMAPALPTLMAPLLPTLMAPQLPSIMGPQLPSIMGLGADGSPFSPAQNLVNQFFPPIDENDVEAAGNRVKLVAALSIFLILHGAVRLPLAVVDGVHGYKRNNNDVASGLAWGALGFLAPLTTTTVSLFQGYGKPKRG